MAYRDPSTHPLARDRERWHPLLAAVEGPIGTWRMIDTLEQEYGVIRLVRLNDEPTYVATMRGADIGTGSSLRLACEQVHRAYVRSGQPAGRIGFESQEEAARRQS